MCINILIDFSFLGGIIKSSASSKQKQGFKYLKFGKNWPSYEGLKQGKSIFNRHNDKDFDKMMQN